MKRIILLGLLAVAWMMSHTAFAAPTTVIVSIAPQKYFAQRIGGDLIDVQVMIPPGADVHSFEPKPRQLVQLSKATVYFTIGIDFEQAWLPRFAAANPNMLIVHTDEGIAKIPMTGDAETADHDHHEDTNHHHEGLDPHVWTSPKRVRIIAENMGKALMRLDPAHQTDYRMGLESFLSDIDKLDGDLTRIFKDRQGEKFMVFHPAWGYFAHDYGLVQIPIEMEGKEPKPAQLQKVIERARRDGIKIVFTQPQMSSRSADAIAKAIGGMVVSADPMAEDWSNNLKAQAKTFEAALK